MKSVPCGLCVVAAIKMSGATARTLATKRSGSPIQVDPITENADPTEQSMPGMRGDSLQHPARPTALDDLRVRRTFPLLRSARSGSEMSAAAFIANLEPMQ
jgi:hypothetical protein